MNRDIFFGWLALFDEHIGREEGRRAVLLVNNPSCHGKTADLPYLRNVDVIYLPKRTTSKLQPIDTGVIPSVKHNFRRRSVERAFDLVDRGVFDNLYGTTFSSGWLREFKSWYVFKSHKSHGKYADANHLIVSTVLPQLQAVMRQYVERNVFNADEFAFFHRRPTKHTIGTLRGAQIMERPSVSVDLRQRRRLQALTTSLYRGLNAPKLF